MLAKPGGKRPLETAPAHGDWQAAKRAGLPTRHRATFLDKSPRVGGDQRSLYVDTRPGDVWLKGRDLQAWKRANPERARLWSGSNEGQVEPPAAQSQA